MKNLVFYFCALLLVICLNSKLTYCNDCWESINCPENRNAWSIFMTKSGMLLMGTGQDINWSSDRGQTWNVAISVNEWAHLVVDFAENSKGQLYAATAEGVFKSSDHGMTWYFLKDEYMVNQVEVDDSDNIYITSTTDSLKHLMYFSSNKGQSWQNITPTGFTVDRLDLIVVNSNFMVVSAGSGILYSMDRGKSWTRGSGLVLEEGSSITSLIRTDKGFIANTFNDTVSTGIYESADGSAWQKITASPENPDVFLLSYNSYNQEIYAIKYNPGILVSRDYGKTWGDFSQGLPTDEYISRIEICNDGYVYASGSTKLFGRAANTGVNDESNTRADDIRIYPAPSNGEFIINTEAFSGRIDKIDLFDTRGCRVTGMNYHQINDKMINVTTGHVFPGLYYLEFRTGGRKIVKSVIILDN